MYQQVAAPYQEQSQYWTVLSGSHSDGQLLFIPWEHNLGFGAMTILLIYPSSGAGYGWLLGFHVLATSKVISGRIPTWDIAHSWRLYSCCPTERPGHQHHSPDIPFSYNILTLCQPNLALCQ